MGVRAGENTLLVRGCVPGAKGGYVVIRFARKREAPARELTATPAEE